MSRSPRLPSCFGLLTACILCSARLGFAQEPPPPPEPPAAPPPPAAEAPPPADAPAQPYAQPYAQPQPQPVQPAQPQPAPQPAQPQSAPQPQAQPAQPQSAPQPPSQPAPQPQAQPAQPYAQPYAEQSQSAPPPPPPPQNHYGPPPPRPQPHSDPAGDGGAGGGFEMPPFAIRIDPFNWLLHGRLGLEFEVGIVGPLTAELVPVFVTNESPALLSLSSIDSEITQQSDGLGAMSGASIGLGIWLNGEPFRGYVLRAVFTNYSYTYEASDSMGVFDRVDFTERRFVAYFGSTSRFGPFLIGGSIGLGYEFNQQERCGLAVNSVVGGGIIADDDGVDCRDQMRIALDRTASSVADLNGFAHPVYLEGRFSLGFAFD